MVFNSAVFACFFVVVFAAAWLLKHRPTPRFALLLAASYVFYGYWSPKFLLLIVGSTVLDYCMGLAMERTDCPRRRKAFVIASLCGNLGVLGFFKYFNFFTGEAVALLNQLGFAANEPTLSIALPVGISFYTFQTLSYTIDVYRGKLEVEHSLLRFALFVAFFPQLVAGPIVRASKFLPQLRKTPTLSLEEARSGLFLMFWGLTKKVVIADFLGATLVDAYWGAPGGELAGMGGLLAIYAYAFQIYGDFSGYSDMAIGAARLLGYELGDNFNAPYRALNPSDFWRRWHISLSQWLRDYLYIPLGGNRVGPVKTYRNLALTMLLGGLWHGASWMFVLWGAFHGAMLIVHRLWSGGTEPDPEKLGYFGRLWRRVGFFHLTCFGWVLFRSADWAQFQAVLSNLAQPTSWGAIGPLHWMALALALASHMPPRVQKAGWRETFVQAHPAFQGAVYAMVIGLAMNTSKLSQPFIYFQF